MKLFATLILALFAATAACSSDESSSTTSSGACAEAKKVADDCNAKQPADGGTSTKITFDQAKCESAGAQGQTMAQCIVTNKSNCDCFLACGIKGSCP
jgi:hypothetical protein